MPLTAQTATAGRLDVFCAQVAEITRSRAASLIQDGCVFVNGLCQTKAGFALRGGEEVQVHLPEPEPIEAQPQDLPIRILYEDADVAVVYKPSGMVVHPAAGNPDGTLVNALLARLDGLSGIGGALRPGIVHRIDKDTSGLLLVAKNDKAHQCLSEQLAAHNTLRAYKAIVFGAMKTEQGDIDAPIGRHPTDRKRYSVQPEGKPAFTHWEVLAPLRGATLVECRLRTGRTHQIRVHMAHIGHPLLGDPVYAPRKPAIDVPGGQLLHAYRIGFVHPTTGEQMVFEAEPEERFLLWYRKLRV